MPTQQEFSRRRRELIGALGTGCAAIVAASPERIRSRDVHYPYRPDSNLLYLTGFAEPEAVAVLVPGRAEGPFVLFCRERDPSRELWDGKRAGPEGAVAEYGADRAFANGKMDEVMPDLLKGVDTVHYDLGQYPAFEARLGGWLKRLREQAKERNKAPVRIAALDYYVHEMRLCKSAAELDCMRRSAALAVAAHKRAMARTRPGMHEYEIEAELIYRFRQGGAPESYPSIVACGANACVLHYSENDALMKEGDLLLVDAGCELRGYASDITRTWPVSGRYTVEQRAVYEIVLEAQRAAIAAIGPGVSIRDPHHAAIDVITKGLRSLGLLKGKTSRLMRDKAYREFFMHGTSHWLGMDVHDVGDYEAGGEPRKFKPGMCCTVEPGIYIAPDNDNAPAPFRGIGVRIEDDVAVTADGCEVLTAALPKDPGEVEALVGSQGGSRH